MNLMLKIFLGSQIAANEVDAVRKTFNVQVNRKGRGYSVAVVVVLPQKSQFVAPEPHSHWVSCKPLTCCDDVEI